MIKLISFDLDNTLWDANPVLYRAEAALKAWIADRYPTMAKHYHTELILGIRQSLIANQPELSGCVSALRKAVLTTFFARQGLSPSAASTAATQAFDYFYAQRQKVTLYKEAIPLLSALSKDYRLVSLSNGNADPVQIGIDHFFDYSINAEMMGGLQKPDPAMFHEALRLTGVKADEMLHVGDHLEQDIGGANRAGVRSVWLNVKAKPASHQIQPDAEINDLSELYNLIKNWPV